MPLPTVILQPANPGAARRPIWDGMVLRRLPWATGLMWSLTPGRKLSNVRSFARVRRKAAA